MILNVITKERLIGEHSYSIYTNVLYYKCSISTVSYYILVQFKSILVVVRPLLPCSLKVEITRLIGHKDRLIARCERYRCFEAFLERTAESSVEYGEVRQLMARYDTLTSSQDVLEFT